MSGISKCISATDGFTQLDACLSMMKKWKEIQPKWRSDADEEHFADTLKQAVLGQKEGETIPIYIRKQNCTLLITKLNEKFTQLCSFRAMLCSETIMSSVGSPTLMFPQTCDIIYNNDLLVSDVFLYQLHQLSVEDFELSLPCIIKGETSYSDYRDVAEPFLVTDWIIGTLVPANPATVTVEELTFGSTQIRKKMRDQVNCQMSSRAIPFRRSGMYMSLKAALELKLFQYITNRNDARLAYKLIMIMILAEICQHYAKECVNMDIDLSSQLIAKLGRRVSKLEGMSLSQETDDGKEWKEKLLLLKGKVLEYCHSAVEGLRTEITNLWRRDASTHSVVKPIIRSKDNFEKDLLHQIIWLDEHIRNALPIINDIRALSKKTQLENIQKADALQKSPDFKRSLQAKRFNTLDDISKNQNAFNSTYSEIDDIHERIWIYDTEHYIKHNLNVDSLGDGEDLEKIQILIVAYFKNAVARYSYKNDPVAFSQMILVILKCLQIMDKICTVKFPLLQRYKPGVKIELFDKLLLPHQRDISLLDEISDYFVARNTNATLSSLIEVNRLDRDSFPVCFARENEGMREILARIQKNTEIAEREKAAEVMRAKAECEQLDRELRSLGGLCKAKDVDDGEIHDNQKGSRSFASITCRRCKTNSILRFKRRVVKIYERPLPVDEYLQYAVIFELKIPPEICLLRDMLALLRFEILGEKIFRGAQPRRSDSDRRPPVENWREYMKRQGGTDDYKSKGGSALNCIDLVSSRLAFSGTCNAKIQNPDVLVADLNKYVVDNDLECVYYHDKPLWFPVIKNTSDICIFQLSSTREALHYQNLQWTVGSTKHNQNQVISQSQTECHRQLNPEEYLAFGSIRADGSRIQLRNLYRAIYDRTLSLEKESIMALTLQVLWQVGQRNEDGVREYHEDLLDPAFSLEFLLMLEDLVESCEGNYSEPLVLMLAVVITVKILEMNVDQCNEMCYRILTKSRNVINDWVEKIEENLVTSASGANATSAVNSLKSNLLEATICSMLSYHVDGENLVEMVIQSKEDYVHWFHAITRLHQLTEQEQCHNSISQFAQILLNTVRNISLKLELEKHLKCTDTTKDVMLQSLHLFTLDKWSKATDCINNTSIWKVFNEKEIPHLLFGGYEETVSKSKKKDVKAQHFLSLDLIQGIFLCNGFPQTNLPTAILVHPLFKRYFKDSKFRIQRYSTCARTVDKFHGRFYDFELVVKKGKEKLEVDSLIVREIQENDDGSKRVLEMIEPVLFRQVVGSQFAENYSHWLDKDKRVVYFRRLPKEDSHYLLPHDYTLSRDDNGNWRIFDERYRKYLLSIHSEGFNCVAEALSRLENKGEINVLLDVVSGGVTAKLPRYNLSFDLVDRMLHSVEYTNFRVSEHQHYGTLIGLSHGLLLESTVFDSKRILIVPHGYLSSCLLTMKHHHNTIIDLDHLRLPRFFVYDYDTVLRQLKADKIQVAWLYLAALHAYTSSSLPDPFTQVTGTERCVEILQSGRVFPSEPYDTESLETLGLIRDLAPRRSYYAHGISFLSDSNKKKSGKRPKEKMEITQWCDVVPSMVSYDGFPFFVDKLIEYSGRLVELHGNKVARQKIQRHYKHDDRDAAEESEKLQLRSYHRHLSLYNQAVKVPPEFFKKPFGEMLGTGEKLECTIRCKSFSSIAEGFCLRELQIISQTRLVNTYEKRSIQQWRSRKCNLESHLISDNPVAPLILSSTSSFSWEGLQLKDLLHMKFEVNWLQLYAWAINKESGQSQAFTLILAALAYTASAPLEQIMHLHHISRFAGEVEFPAVPAVCCSTPRRRSSSRGDQEDNLETEEDLIIPVECTFEVEQIQEILECNMIPPVVCGEELADMELHIESVRADAVRIAAQLQCDWPCQNIPVNERVKELFKDSSIRFRDAMSGVNSKIGFWYRNLKFNQFVENVQEKLTSVLKQKLENREIEESQNIYQEFQFLQFQEMTLRLGLVIDGVRELSIPAIKTNRLDEATKIFETGSWLEKEDADGKNLDEQRQLYTDKISKLIQNISDNVVGARNEIEKKIIFASGIAPRVTPTLLLRHLMDVQLQRENNPLWIYVGALAVLWTHLKRINRCIVLKKKGVKEEKNLGHENWSPKEHPQWLLLELELDIMIWDIQVDVARQMMEMPNEKNGVMQLNMGQGKTSTIVPQLCSTLASEDMLCRVTVLSSIFKTNLNILRFAIGGLLNRRVYTFPCRRNIKLDMETADILTESLEECLKVRGVILTVPEHRLSFGLLAFDKILKREYQLGAKLLQIGNWLRYFCRDILDESDELLNVKYQLVYTTGSQVPIDGDSLRWTVCQKILKSAKNVAGKLVLKYGSDAIEFDEDKQNSFPEQFTTFRLLSDECLEELIDEIAEEMLTDFKLNGVLRMVAKLFMTEELISEESHKRLFDGLQGSADLRNKILLASAYMRRDILAVALKKRWRVEYGVNPAGERLMAIPFRAKDVAVERNEFGHPDLAIVLSHLSYYYSGLMDDQLRECFEMLKNERGGEEIYDDWIRQMLPHAVPPNLSLFQRLNIADPDQTQKLFDLLRKHTGVINFWLSHKVFPRESKQFTSKLVMTGWDMCHERNRHPITGFSGTNDSKGILPLTISQQDLEKLIETNREQEEALLEPRNSENNKGFRMGVTCREILISMKNDNLRVLIDSGALMLECNNAQVADLWLEIDPDIEAVIYYGENGDQMVKIRNDNAGDENRRHYDIRLEESPYKYHLEKCAVFLDDQHTRGVDFKFPDESKACVTVGSRMKREKLVQASMRMRKLLSGEHSVTFYLSHEAHCKVNNEADDIETEDILEWTKQNTAEYNEDGLLYLSLNGLNYAQKLVAEDNFNFPFHATPLKATSKSNGMLEILANQCSNDEVTTLEEMYGHYSKRERLVDILPNWFEMARKRIVSVNGKCSAIPAAVLSTLENIMTGLVRRCEDICEDKSVFSSCGANVIEEEQEKELEKEKETEVEEEREVHRSGPPVHFTPDLHSNVKLAVVTGGDELTKKPGILLISEIFKDTTFSRDIQPDCWGECVYATEDFARVIHLDGIYSSTDSYLRQIHWIASQKGPDNEIKLLVLSSFEVNEMMPLWKKGDTVMQLHTFCRRRFQNQDLLMNNAGLQLPSGRNTGIPENCMALAPLSVASGNLYFGSDEEREAYSRFLEVREVYVEEDEVGHKFFERDPTEMVRKILSSRHCVLSEVSHVMCLLDGK